MPYYVGRQASAAPATGSYKKHLQEQALLVEQALSVPVAEIAQPFIRVTKLSTVQNPKQARTA
jgi:2-oxoglutarate dehydrogenase E1 component